MRRRTGIAWVIGAGLAASAPHAALAKIGVAAAVVPSAYSGLPDGAARSLAVGSDLEAGERVRTGASGSLQILFEDRSSMALGPDAEMVLDEYIYRPEQGDGALGVSLGKGLLRFVGGAISKTAAVSVRTPTATIGIRGGIAIVEAGAATSATFLYGVSMTVTAGGESVTIARPGFRIAIGPDGRPGSPEAIPADTLGNLLRGLEPAPATPDAPAGSDVAVADDDVAQSQLSLLNDVGLLGEVETAAGGGETPPPLPAAPEGVLAIASQQEPGRRPPEDAAGIGEPDPDAPEPGPDVAQPGAPQPGVPDATDPPRLAGPLSGRIKLGSTTGEGEGDPARNRPLSGGSFESGRFEAEDPGGARLTLVLGPAGFASSAEPFGVGGLTGQAVLSSADFVVFELTGAGGQRALAFAGEATPAAGLPTAGVSRYELRADFLRQQSLPFLPDVVDPATGATSGPGAVYMVWDDSAPGAQRAFGGGAVAIAGAGPDQQRAISVLFGALEDDGEGRPHVRAQIFGLRRAGDGRATTYRGGVASADAADGADLFGAQAEFVLEAAKVDGGDAVLGRGLTQSDGGVLYANHVAAAPTAQIQSRTKQTLTGYAAGLERVFDGATLVKTETVSTQGQLGVAIASDPALNTLSAVFKLQSADPANPLQIQFGEAAPSGLSAFIDDSTFMATSQGSASGDGFALITASELQHTGFVPAGVSFCACSFVTWGFWTGERGTAPGAQARQVELAAWVAGQPFDGSLVGLPVQTASYSGHLVGEVASGGAHYQAAGGLTLSIRFAPGGYRLQDVAITSFDGRNFASQAGSLTPTFTTNAYSSQGFTVTSGDGIVTARLRGAFFGAAPAGQPPLETAGDFEMTGAGYRAAGIYAARR